MGIIDFEIFAFTGKQLLQWFDSHCHLDRLPESVSLDEVLDRALAAGVARMVVPGVTGVPGNLAELLTKSQVYPAWGVHPAFIEQSLLTREDNPPWVKANYLPVAIGECGLDRRSSSSLALQCEVFAWQLCLAQQNKLPVIVHLVGHLQCAFDLMATYKSSVVFVMHSWSGSPEMAARFVKIGAYISLSASCLRNPAALVKLFAAIPLSALIIETDTPDMCLSGWPRLHNEPSALPAIAAEIAKITGADLEKLAEILYTNATKIFTSPERKHKDPVIFG